MKKLIFILVVLAITVPSFGALIAEKNYDSGNVMGWDYYPAGGQFISTDTTLVNGAGWTLVDDGNGGQAGDGAADAGIYVYGDNPSIVGPVGRIEMDFRPHWSGINQGGVGVGGSGSFQNLIQFAPAVMGGKGINVGIWNSGAPDDGGQVVAWWSDDVQSVLLSDPTYGTTANWVAEQWHTVAIEWGPTTLTLKLDGLIVEQAARLNDPMELAYLPGGYLDAWAYALWYDAFDGAIDNIKFYDDANALPTRAHAPAPSDTETLYMPDVLSWRSSHDAVTHKVYWSGVEAEVTGRTVTPITLTRAIDGNSTPVPGTHALDTAYYWAVDEVNSAAVTSSGRLWRYTTEEFLYVDDMDDYDVSGTSTGNEIWNVWVDGYPGPGGLDNGAAVVGTDSAPSGVGRAMEYSYSNNGTSPYGPSTSKYYSEIVADTSDLECGSDWTERGTTWLWVNFTGNIGNDVNEQLYIVIEDSTPTSAMVKYGQPDSYSNQTSPIYGDEDPNYIAGEAWRRWAIDLRSFTGVDLTDVQKVYIGFGERGNTTTPGGTGKVIFDNIALVLTGLYGTPESLVTDLYNDGVINFKDVSVLANDWAVVEYDGTWPIY